MLNPTTPAPDGRVLAKASDAMTRAHADLFRHKKTRMFSNVILLGTSEVLLTKDAKCSTAWTDGLNKWYCAEYMLSVPEPVRRATILHENLHVGLMHIGRTKGIDDHKLLNIAADYVVNDIILHIDEPNFIALGDNWFYDPMFHGWHLMEVYRYLKKEQESGKGKQPKHPPHGGGMRAPSNTRERPESGNDDSMDFHDHAAGQALPEQQKDEAERTVRKAVEEGVAISRALGADVPIAVNQALIRAVDWESLLREFLSSSMRGDDDYTYRKFDMRALTYGVFRPGTEAETLPMGLISIDASGSTLGPVLDKFMALVQDMLTTFPPEEMRVLCWDTQVRSEQRFDMSNYDRFSSDFKLRGGGNTLVTCVDKYMQQHGLRPDFHVVLTDGYVGDQDQWTGDRSIPTLWIVTECRRFKPPFGQLIFVEG
jgi:predicted metal-dependent peptidase